LGDLGALAFTTFFVAGAFFLVIPFGLLSAVNCEAESFVASVFAFLVG